MVYEEVSMNKIPTGFKDLFVLEPRVHGDARGYFLESYNKNVFQSLGLDYSFVQDNESLSSYGTLRGLHFQIGTSAQAKLVRAVAGRVLDVVVDLRENEPTFGKHFKVELSSENKKQLLVPRGFAHGFVVLSEKALFQYKVDNFYDPAADRGIAFDDTSLGIDWTIPAEQLLLSDKDKKHPTLKEWSARQ